MSTHRARIIAAILVVAAGLSLAALASRSGRPFSSPPPASQRGGPPVPPPPPPTTTPTEADLAHRGAQGGQLHIIAYVYVLLGIAIMFFGLAALPFMIQNRGRRWWSIRRRYRDRTPRPPPLRPAAPVLLADAVESALAALDDGPVDDAIVACWVGLERAAAAAGTPRTVAETSQELTERVLAEHNVSPETLRELAALYREARFSAHPLQEEHRELARRLFEQARDELRVRA